MKTICAVLLAVIFSFELHAQPGLTLKLSNKKSFISNSLTDTADNMSRNLQHFPFQFGIEGCFSTWGTDDATLFGGLGYVNINIWAKTVLLKFEYGMFISSSNYLFNFVSLSGQYKFADIKNLHKFYGGLGICGLAGEEFGGGSYFVNFKYLYATNENVGLTGGFRLFAPGQDIKNFWRGFLFEAGIQIFH
jgi:hypothetical protein